MFDETRQSTTVIKIKFPNYLKLFLYKSYKEQKI